MQCDATIALIRRPPTQPRAGKMFSLVSLAIVQSYNDKTRCDVSRALEIAVQGAFWDDEAQLRLVSFLPDIDQSLVSR